MKPSFSALPMECLPTARQHSDALLQTICNLACFKHLHVLRTDGTSVHVCVWHHGYFHMVTVNGSPVPHILPFSCILVVLQRVGQGTKHPPLLLLTAPKHSILHTQPIVLIHSRHTINMSMHYQLRSWVVVYPISCCNMSRGYLQSNPQPSFQHQPLSFCP